MLVNVRLFASYREAAGVGHLQLELKPGAKVRDAIAEVVKAHPLIAEGRQVVIARNRDYVDVDAPLADGDELALIPPVSGGATGSLEAIALTDAPLSVDEALTIVLASAATVVGVVALLLVPVSLVVSHPVNVVGEAAVLALCVWYVARVMRADRRRRHAAEAALPPALRPARRQPRRPIAFQL